MQRAISERGVPEIVNTDQGCQLTSAEFTPAAPGGRVKLSMEGKDWCLDSVFVEQLWRMVKYEDVYPKSYCSLVDAHAQLETHFRFYNERPPHTAKAARPARITAPANRRRSTDEYSTPADRSLRN